ncbi:MAG TPA: tryptophan 7-halogenase [Mycobacteriales bacterium]|jgi:flavin-dependent dehydrogenase|nr:tryptophan 7-halogenase [Mycobacteriales bacterium]
MARVVVAGGSVAGLWAALALGARGHDVTVVERDPPPPADPFAWERPGTPQLRQSHAFLGKARALVREREPELHATLLALGARETRADDHLPPSLDDTAPRDSDDDIVTLSARRPLFDWALRRHAEAAGVRVVPGNVAGLLTETRAGVPHVTGVGLEGGEAVAADVVVDATGRRTRTPRWLAEAGVPLPEWSTPCGNRYYTRYYELPADVADPPVGRGFVTGMEVDAFVVLVFLGEGRTFSVSVQTEDDDEPMRVLRHPAAFDAAVRMAPWVEEWLALGARPLGDPCVMAGQADLVRRTVDGGRPLVTGLLLAGDATATSNPAFGRGVSLAMAGVELLAAALGEDEPEVAYDAAVLREIEPFVRNSRDADERTRNRWRHRLYGEPLLPPPDGLTFDDVVLASLRDRDVWEQVARSGHLMLSPDAVLADPLVRERTAAVRATGWTPPAGPPLPSREDVLAAANAAL